MRWITGFMAGVRMTCALTAAGLDRNANGLDDIWELAYSVRVSGTGLDSDGDGYTDAEEGGAGTNPFDPDSAPRLRLGMSPGGGLSAQWPAVPGKEYRLLQNDSLGPGGWTAHSEEVAEADSIRRTLGAETALRFFRLEVGDVDSDGDGLTDAEERWLGLDPHSERSERLDMTDLQRVTARLGAANRVTLGVLDGRVSERWPDPGVIAVRRSGGIAPITVHFVLGGTAEPGSDYRTSVTNAVTLPLGAREAWIELHPIADTDDSEPDESITVTLLPGTDYSLDTPDSVSVTLRNETPTSGPFEKEAARFLIQAAFGPDQDSPADADDVPENVEEVMSLGFDGWIEHQFGRPIGFLQPWVDWAAEHAQDLELYGDWKKFAWWGRVMGSPHLRPDAPDTVEPDPLRQRMAFALSEILVTSDGPESIATEQVGMANYYDLMVRHAFGNYHDLLLDVALHPVMGIYLSHLGNRKADPVNRIYPDENFAREIMQLFTIGLWELHPDGTRKRDADGQPIPTYGNADITELARVFTGLSFGNNEDFNLFPRDFTVPMRMWDAEHDCGPKRLLQGLELPARIPAPGHAGTAGMADIRAAVGHLFRHPNVGPFIGRQLIQRFVTSNPSPGFVGRVAAAFDDNGSGVRGDLKAVLRAILLDPEARDAARMDDPTWGRLREPLLRVVNFARAFNAASASGHYALDQFTLDHLQDVMSAPSVFNFFLPAHSPPGPLTELGLVAPEFQIINASSAITGPNYFWNAIPGDLHRYGHGNPDHAVRLNTDVELALIVPAGQIGEDVPGGPPMDPDPLLRRLDLALTGGTLSPGQFRILREAMERIRPPTWKWHRERLRLAIYLIVTSADYNVFR